MKTLKSFSELREVKRNSIGKDFGTLIRTVRSLPTSSTFEKGKMTKFKFHTQNDSWYEPFIDADDGLLKIFKRWNINKFSKKERLKLPYKEYTLGEFVKNFKTIKK